MKEVLNFTNPACGAHRASICILQRAIIIFDRTAAIKQCQSCKSHVWLHKKQHSVWRDWSTEIHQLSYSFMFFNKTSISCHKDAVLAGTNWIFFKDWLQRAWHTASGALTSFVELYVAFSLISIKWKLCLKELMLCNELIWPFSLKCQSRDLLWLCRICEISMNWCQ